jgi:hypothetical protein
VRIQCDTLEARRGHEAVPVVKRLEGIVDEEERIALLTAAVRETDVAVAVVPVLLNGVKHLLAVEACGLVERRDDDPVAILVLVREGLDDCVGASDVTALRRPLRGAHTLTRVVEAYV